MARLWMVIGIAACLGACSQEAPEATNATAIAEQPAPAPQPAAATPLLNLTGEGLALVDPNTGSSRALDFGSDQAMVRQAVAATGRAPLDDNTNAECPAGPLAFIEFAGGMTLWFEEGKFAGWALRSDAARELQTAAGLGVGSTRAELDAAYDAKVEESTLGQEFQAGAISGILNSAAPDGKVEALWAGVNCVFR